MFQLKYKSKISNFLLITCLGLTLIYYYTSENLSVGDGARKWNSKCWYCINFHWTKNDGTNLSTTSKPTEITCVPTKQIVFLKTHKTGSSTITSMLQTFGFLQNLTFALPKHGHIISRDRFKRNQVLPGTYDLLVNHVRYNREEMEAVTKPGTKYVTIIRDPATQLESVFGYFQLYKPLHLGGKKNPFRTFISKPEYYLRKYKKFCMRSYLRNPLLYDFGLNLDEQLNISTVKHTIRKLDEEFDLVMIQEYFNESLLLLKKLFCWKWDDILYLTKGVRIKKLRYSDQDRTMKLARNWCASDAILYDYFNVTFWKKVKEYGPEFEKDLQILHTKLNETKYECTQPDAKPKIFKRAYHAISRPGANQLCQYKLKSDTEFTKFIEANQKRYNLKAKFTNTTVFLKK